MDILVEFFLRPMLNLLLLLYGWLGGNFGVAIVAFTVIVRLLMLPLTLQQLRQSKKMSALAPKLTAIRNKYKNDPQRQQQETMALYREAGVNPIGCLGPMVIQFPIWIGLYSAIYSVVPSNAGRLVPEGMLNLSNLLYPFLPQVWATTPLDREFLWLDLSATDPFFILAILVGGTMWIQQKMAINPDAMLDPQQSQMNRTMLTIMPLMFAFFTFTVASGLALYWLVSNIISIVMQYFVTGWGSLAGWNPLNSVQNLASLFGFGRPQPALATTPRRAPAGPPAAGTAPGGNGNDDNASPTRSRRRSTNARSRGKRSNR